MVKNFFKNSISPFFNKKLDSFRMFIQGCASILSNGYIMGFLEGKIYTGKLKMACVPGLNCYSCMGALGSCPIGAIQSVLNQPDLKIPFYVFGFLMFLGSLLGRFVCGFLCPFGFFQDLLHKIPFPFKKRHLPYEKHLVKLKYVILLVFVILLPMLFVNDLGLKAPYFCKLICPVGTLQGGIPFSISNEYIRMSLGWLFSWKMFLLIVTIIGSMITYRPFCKFVCPLGAFYSFFNKVALNRYSIDMNSCIHCGKCASVCLMNVDPVADTNALECIHCNKCKNICPTEAIHKGGVISGKTKEFQHIKSI